MREGMPTPEYTPEYNEGEQKLIEMLKEKPEDPETKSRLLEWTKQQEAEANRINTSRANIEVNIKRAKLYRAAGFLEEAWETLEDVRRQSFQEEEKDLYELAMSIMDEIDSEAEGQK